MGRKTGVLCIIAAMLLSFLYIPGYAAQDDFNIGFYAEVTTCKPDGSKVSAGNRGENYWRTWPQTINDYFIFSDPNYWGYSYSFNATEAPIYVNFDYGSKAASVNEVVLGEANRKGIDITRGRYTKVKLQYQDGEGWATIVPSDAPNGEYSVDSDGTVALNWNKPTSTQNLPAMSNTADFINILFDEYITSYDFRLEILEVGEPNGDAYGEIGIDEVIMNGHYATDAEVDVQPPAFLEGYAKKAVSVIQKNGIAENIEKARSLVDALPQGEVKDSLLPIINKPTVKPWTNLALDATVSGAGGGSVAMLNDGNADGTSNWQVDPLNESTSFTYDYKKTVTVNSIQLGGRDYQFMPKKVAVYGISGKQESKIGEYDISIAKVPGSYEFDPATDFAKSAFKQFEKDGYMIDGNICYSDFATIVLDVPVVCDKLRIQILKHVETAGTKINLSEARTFGVEGANVEYNYTPKNMAFLQPASVTDMEGNLVYKDAPRFKSSFDYLTDYNIRNEGYYTTMMPYDKLPLYVTVDYQGELVELNQLTLTEAGTPFAERIGQIQKIEMEMFDGESWVPVTASETQIGGVTVNANAVTLDWSNLSRSEDGDTKGARFMDIAFARPHLGYQFRFKVVEAIDSWGGISLDEVLTWGWKPVEADLENRDNAAQIKTKNLNYLLDYAIRKPTKHNIDALKTAVAAIESGEEKTKWQAAADKIIVRDVIRNTTASAGIKPERASALNDGKYEFPDQWWESGTAVCNDDHWVQLAFDGKKEVNSVRVSTRYYPCSLLSVDVYAKINGELVKIMENTPVYQANVPELGSSFASNIPFDAEGKKAYADNGLLRSDGTEINWASWYQIDLPQSVECSAIRIQVLACESWGSGICEMEVIGGDPATQAANVLTCSADFDTVEALKTAGTGAVEATVVNQQAEERKATLMVFFYQDDKLLKTYCKESALAAGTTQNISLEFSDIPPTATKVVYSVWGSIKDQTDLKPLTTQVEVK